MQTAICGKIPCFKPRVFAKPAPQVDYGTADPAARTIGAYDRDEEESNITEDGLTREDLMDVLSLYLF